MKSKSVKTVAILIITIIGVLITTNVSAVRDSEGILNKFNFGVIENNSTNLGAQTAIQSVTLGDETYNIWAACGSVNMTNAGQFTIHQGGIGTNFEIFAIPTGSTEPVNPEYATNSDRLVLSLKGNEFFNVTDSTGKSDATIYGWSTDGTDVSTVLKTNIKVIGKQETSGVPLIVELMSQTNKKSVSITLFNVAVTKTELKPGLAGALQLTGSTSVAVGETTTLSFGQSITWNNISNFITRVIWNVGDTSILEPMHQNGTSHWETFTAKSEGTTTVSAIVKAMQGETVIASAETATVTVKVGPVQEQQIVVGNLAQKHVIEQVGGTAEVEIGETTSIVGHTPNSVVSVSKSGSKMILTGLRKGATHIGVGIRPEGAPSTQYYSAYVFVDCEPVKTIETSVNKQEININEKAQIDVKFTTENGKDAWNADEDTKLSNTSVSYFRHFYYPDRDKYEGERRWENGAEYIDPNPVISVSESGEITGLRPGKAIVVMDVPISGTNDSMNVRQYLSSGIYILVKQPVTGVSFNESTHLKINIGDSISRTATIEPTDATDKFLTYESSNTNVVKVDGAGTVLAVGEGTAAITVRTQNGKTATYTVTVDGTIRAEGIILNENRITLQKGATKQLSATITPSNSDEKEVEWTSSNENVVQVDSTGKLTAVGKGTASITATVKGTNIKTVCAVTVEQIQVTGISIESNVTIEKENTKQLQPTVIPTGAEISGIIWSSSNESVAEVDSTGKLTAIAKGTAKITARVSGTEIKSVCTVTVTETIVEPKEEISSSKYEVKTDKKVITNIPKQTEIKTALENVSSTKQIEVYDKNDNKVTDTTKKIATGMKMKTVTESYSIVVPGDTNGDGDIGLLDIVKVIKHMLEKEQLEGVYFQAAALSGKEDIGLQDIVKMIKIVLE